MTRLEPIVLERRPNLVGLGDVNSTVAAALVCSELLIQVGQVEAGRRSFERTMPEEINRPLSDHLADLLFRQSEDGDENLEREGVPRGKSTGWGNEERVLLTPPSPTWPGSGVGLRHSRGAPRCDKPAVTGARSPKSAIARLLAKPGAEDRVEIVLYPYSDPPTYQRIIHRTTKNPQAQTPSVKRKTS